MSKEYSQDRQSAASNFREASHQSPTHRHHLKKTSGRLSVVFLLLAPSLALLAAFTLSAGKAKAAEAPPLPDSDAITITSETQTFTYATQITFQVSASDTVGKITAAQLEIIVQPIGIDHHIDVPVAQPGPSVTLTYHYNPGSDYLPPYSPVTYRWTFSDNAQHSLTGPAQHFDFADTRFSWQHLTRSNITVYWYDQNTAYGQNILDTAVQEAASIQHDLNGTVTDPLKVIAYASNEDLQGGLPANSPIWAGGVALIPFEEALIVVGDQSYALQRDLPHELTHLILHQIAGLNCGGCPLWFDEGMAVYHQLYHEPEMQFAFDNAVKDNELLPFNSLADQFPNDTDQAEIAYAQSWNYIKYLYRTYTQPKVARLVNALRTNNFARAFQQAFGASPDTLENQWRVSLGLEPTSNSPQSTPATGNTPTSSQSAGTPGFPNTSGLLSALAIVVFVLLASGLVTVIFVTRRSSQATAPSTGASAPPPFFPMQPQGISTDPRYQGKIAQRQALLHSIENAVAAEKRLHMQQANLEGQIALYAAQERQARAEGATNRAMLALDRRQKLESLIPSLQQQLAQVRLQRLNALQQERLIATEIDAAFSQHAVLVHQTNPMQAWPQVGSTIPLPGRRVSQE
jgi:hypothetical protein